MVGGLLTVVFQILSYFATVNQSVRQPSPAPPVTQAPSVSLSDESIDKLVDAVHHMFLTCSANSTRCSDPSVAGAVEEALTRTSALHSGNEQSKRLMKRKLGELSASFVRFHPWAPETPHNASHVRTDSAEPVTSGHSSMFWISVLLINLGIVLAFQFRSAQRATTQFTGQFKDKIRPAKQNEEPPSESVPTQGSSSALPKLEQRLGQLRSRRPPVEQYKLDQIWEAAFRGESASVLRLLSEHANFDVNALDVKNEYGTVLAAAAQGGHVDLIKNLLTRGARVGVHGGPYLTSLQAAAHSGSYESVGLLLDKEASPAELGGLYGSALNAAVVKGCLDSSTVLIPEDRNAREAVLTAVGDDSTVPFMNACIRGYQELVFLLLENGASPDAAMKDGTTALHMAASDNKLEVAKLLTSNNASINARSESGTPFEVAIDRANEDLALFLFDHHANVDLPYGTPREEATNRHPRTWHDFEKLRSAILQKSSASDLNAGNGAGETILHHAAMSGHIKTVSHLIHKGVDLAVPDSHGRQALTHALLHGHKGIAKLLLEAGAPVNALDGDGTGAIHEIVEFDHDHSLIDLLVAGGADVNLQDAKNRTPLHIACEKHLLRYSEVLLEHHALTNVLDSDDCTPLDSIFKHMGDDRRMPDRLKDLVLLLLDQPNLDLQLGVGAALQAAVYSDQLEIVQRLLDLGADVCVDYGIYNGVLQIAARSGSVGMLQLLVQPQFKINVNQNGGRYGSPLQAAVFSQSADKVRILLDHGADVNQEVGGYGFPLDAAGVRGFFDVLEVLVKHGAEDAKEERTENSSYGNVMNSVQIPSASRSQRMFDVECDSETEGEWETVLDDSE